MIMHADGTRLGKRSQLAPKELPCLGDRWVLEVLSSRGNMWDLGHGSWSERWDSCAVSVGHLLLILLPRG